MKKVRCKKLATLCMLTIISLSSMSFNASAFSGPTHEYVTLQGIRILVSTMGADYSDFYDNSSKEQLKIYCVKPDEDEKIGAYKWHFYNPATQLNFMGEEESALKKFIDHYNRAVLCYKEDKIYESMEELGRSIHFLEDLNTPVHTNNQSMIDAGINALSHTRFESRCIEIQERFIAEVTPTFYNYYKYNFIIEIGKSSANLASGNFYLLTNEIKDTDTIAGNAIMNAQKSVSGILYKFCQDVDCA